MENIQSTEKCNNEHQKSDPLESIGDEVSPPKYFTVDCVVFAEPLNNVAAVKNSSVKKGVEAEDLTIKLNENVTIRKRTGKGKNLFVCLQDQSNLNCPVANCAKSFSSSTLLRTHIRKVHYSEKRYTCEVCGASFTAQYLLRRHSAVHTTEKKQCPVCKKMLSLRTNLSQHLRSHSDTRRHECVTCGKRFLRSSTLKNHLQTTHNEAL